MMKISVVIPAYNCEKTIERTVNSISRCGLPEYEIVLIDDGSLDNTPALCDLLSVEKKNVRCFHQQNRGVSSARNRGLAEATGDYVWFFDSDDYVDPNSMVRAAQVIEDHKPDVLVFGISFDYYYRHDLYQRLEFCYSKEIEMTRNDIDKNFSELYRSDMLTSSCNKLFRRALLSENDLRFNTALFSMEDFHFVLCVLKFCSSVYFLPQIIYRYVQATEMFPRKKHRNHDRMSKIENIAEYLGAYESLLNGHEDVLVSLYYMMLKEKIRKQTPKQISITAEEFRKSNYSSGVLFALCTPNQKKIAQQLLSEDYIGVFLTNIKSRARKMIIDMVKRTRVFRWINTFHEQPR